MPQASPAAWDYSNVLPEMAMKRDVMAQALGWLGLYGFAGFGWLGVAGVNLGLCLVLLATLLKPPPWRLLRRDPGFWLVLIALVYLLWVTPGSLALSTGARWDAMVDWSMLLMFWPVAWWLGGRLERVRRVWLLLGAGLLLGMLVYLADPSHVRLLLDGYRSGFHLKKPVAFGLYAGTLLLGLLLLAPRCWGGAALGSRGNSLRFVLWLILVLALVQGVIVTQSRGVWWALLVVAPVVLLLRYRPWRRGHQARGWPVRLAVLMLAGLVLLNLPVLQQRLQAEQDVIAGVMQGSDELPLSSISLRLHLWRLAQTHWQERPLTGWGPASAPYLIARDGHPASLDLTTKLPLDHLHNSYWEIMLRFGLLGALLAAALAGVVLWTLVLAWRRGDLPGDYALWLLAVFVFTALWAITDFRALHYDWRTHWVLLAGAAYTWRWRRSAIPSNRVV